MAPGHSGKTLDTDSPDLYSWKKPNLTQGSHSTLVLAMFCRENQDSRRILEGSIEEMVKQMKEQLGKEKTFMKCPCTKQCGQTHFISFLHNPIRTILGFLTCTNRFTEAMPTFDPPKYTSFCLRLLNHFVIYKKYGQTFMISFS